MHRALSASLSLLLAITVATGALALYANAHNSLATASANELRDWAVDYKSSHGTLPASRRTATQSILGALPGPSVYYVPVLGDCIIYYEEWPLGPKQGLECSSGKWVVQSS